MPPTNMMTESKKSSRNPPALSLYGNRTPLVPRIIILFMYATVAQQGFTLLHLYITEGIKVIAIEKLLTSMKLASAVYGIELFIAFAFGMVSLQGVKLNDHYEHHLPAFCLGLAVCLLLSSKDDILEADEPFMDVIMSPLCIGLAMQVDEVWHILRTFVSGWPQVRLWMKLVHKVIGMVDSPILCLSTLYFVICCLQQWDLIINGNIWKMLIFFLAMYFSILLHTRYIKEHFRAFLRTYGEIKKMP